MRIWHQSFTDLQKFPTYAATLQRHADDAVGQGTVVVHGLLPGTYPEDVPPMDVNRYPYIKALHELQLCEAVLTADELGYDAIALACFFDPGLQLLRSLTDVPVLGLAETCMLAACSLGRRFATVSMSPFQRELTEQLASDYGLADRLAGSIELHPRISLFDLERDDQAVTAIAQSFRDGCGEALQRGAEVIIPGDGVLNEFVLRHGLFDVEGAVVMDALGVLLHQAVAAADTRAATGLTVSRRGRYARPPDDVLNHARQVAGRNSVAEGRFSGPGYVGV